MATWLVHNYGEPGAEGWQVEVEAETRDEAIKKAPHDWKDPDKRYFGAVLKEETMQHA